MSLGEILDRTAQLYRTHFSLFAGIAAVYAGVLLVLNLMQIGLSQLLKSMHMAGQQIWVSLGFVVLILPVMVIVSGAAIAANNRAVAWVNLGKAATIRGAYKSILPRIDVYKRQLNELFRSWPRKATDSNSLHCDSFTLC